MSLLGRLWFGGKKRREARRALESRVRSLLETEGAAPAWRALAEALPDHADSVELFHLASLVLRGGGEREAAELFDRAADAPHDPQRLFELGSHLLSSDQPESAAAILERALAFVPFDAVVRSELAIAHTRSGRPREAVEALALHPCLGDDPGALFTFAWASMLAGDLDAARGALAELRGADALKEKLRAALARADIPMADPPDARDYYFLEHGGLVIDAGGEHGGRYSQKTIDAGILESAAWAVRELVEDPRVVAIDEAHEPIAKAFAAAIDAPIAAKGRTPSTILPVLNADAVDGESAGSALVFALSAPFDRRLARAPDIVGAFARSATVSLPLVGGERRALEHYVEPRRALLFPREKYAYAPDEPLPRR